VNSDIASEHFYPVNSRRLRHRVAAPDQSAPDVKFRLSRRGALIVISAASLGLWAAIAAGIRSLVPLLMP